MMQTTGPASASGGMQVISGARVVGPQELLESADIVIQGDRIVEIVEHRDPENWRSAGAQVTDAGGLYALPGMFDIHSDYIEHMAAPRPTSMMDFTLALRETERELVGHGITCMFHSLSLYKTTEFGDRPIRQPDNIKRFLEVIERSHQGHHIIRHRFHARFEIDNLDRIAELRTYIEQKRIHLLSFMDHTPGQGQYRDLEMFRKTLKGYRDLTDTEIDQIVEKHQSQEKISLETIRELSNLAIENGISVASHDDDTVEKVALVKDFGTSISEFPITIEVARAAKEAGLFTIVGAPNVLLGGSHSGNLSAEDAILEGVAHILCSDYYPAAMLHSIFQLHQKYPDRLSLSELVRLVSLHPAQAVGMGEDHGSIEVGKKADIFLVEMIPGFQAGEQAQSPAVRNVWIDGEPVYSAQYRQGEKHG